MMFYVFSFLAAGIFSGFVDWAHFVYFAYFAGQSELQRDFESQHWKQKSRRRDSGSSQPSYCPGREVPGIVSDENYTENSFWTHSELILNTQSYHRATAHAMMVVFILIVLDSSWFLRHCGIAALRHCGMQWNSIELWHLICWHWCPLSNTEHWATWGSGRGRGKALSRGRTRVGFIKLRWQWWWWWWWWWWYMVIYGDIWWWFNYQDGDEVMKLCSQHVATASMLQQSRKIRCKQNIRQDMTDPG